MTNQQVNIDLHNKTQRDYYEKRSDEQNWRLAPTSSPYIKNHLSRLIEFGALSKQDKILDIGCGMGKFTIPLAQRGFNIEAVDLSPVLLQELTAQCADNIHISTHCIDILHPPKSFQQRYDTIIGAFMLHHLVDINAALKQIRSMLNSSGKIVFLDVNPFCPLYYLQITLSPSMSWKAEKGLINLTPRKITRGLLNAGFSNIKIEKYGIAPPEIRNRSMGEVIDNTFDALTFLNNFAAFQLISADCI